MQVADLLLGDLDLLERRRDLLEGQIAALAAAARSAPRSSSESRERLFARLRVRLSPVGLGTFRAPASASKHVRLLWHDRPPAPERARSIGTLVQRIEGCAAPGAERGSRTLMSHGDDRDRLGHAATASRRPGRPPATEVSLTRVGVTGVEKVIRVAAPPAARRTTRRAASTSPSFECFVDLNPQQAGVHMSRFEEIVNEAIDEVVLGETLRAEELAAHIAEQRPRAPGRPPRRGLDHRPLPGDGADPGLAASRPRRSTRCSAPRSPPSAAPGR